MRRYAPQAHRTLRVPLWPLTLVLMLLSAVVTVAVIWWALSVLFSMAQYIQTVAP